MLPSRNGRRPAQPCRLGRQPLPRPGTRDPRGRITANAHRHAIRTDRPLRGARDARPGRHGCRLQGQGSADRSRRRDQDARARPVADRGGGVPEALRARGEVRGRGSIIRTSSRSTIWGRATTARTSRWSSSRAARCATSSIPVSCCAPRSIADIAVQVADGLAFAHQNEVVHCDIKPANIMVLENGAVKIMDFGIAMLPTGSRTFAGNVLGSPRYISPEQIAGRPVDARSDIFALGAVLYEMLTGVPPFAGTAIDEILYQVINEKPEPPSVRNGSLPTGFDEIVARAMCKQVDDRYQRVAGCRVRRCESSSSSPSACRSCCRRSRVSRRSLRRRGLPQWTSRARRFRVQGPSTSGRPPRRAAGWRSTAVPAALVLMVVAWKLLSPTPGAQDRPVEQSASTSADTSNAAALKQPIAPDPARRDPAASHAAGCRSESCAAGWNRTRSQRRRRLRRSPQPNAATNAVSGVSGSQSRRGARSTSTAASGALRRRMTELKLPPGTYKVEIRNTSFAPYSQTVELGCRRDAPHQAQVPVT